ncbi:hypothetical protein [Basilea psittacipulmonis]|uniref:Uncharacterized protein n=1 Tax=Basilea psittacipulmonis DSM 24701 TaxID=1072685 RepID=A0A077DHU5_9BURK|nr:hypothetical protein [Basilea psittacipulmonis]AIL33112.1 hypothetical protein IX83_07185 [Basilea psittacipulmonis DSM 24701]
MLYLYAVLDKKPYLDEDSLIDTLLSHGEEVDDDFHFKKIKGIAEDLAAEDERTFTKYIAFVELDESGFPYWNGDPEDIPITKREHYSARKCAVYEVNASGYTDEQGYNPCILTDLYSGESVNV